MSSHRQQLCRRAGNDSPEPNESPIEKPNTMTTITTTPASKSSVLNLRLDDETKALIAGEAIRDGRSMSQIALRAIKLGLAQMVAPVPTPVVAVVEEAKPAKAKAKAKASKPASKPRKK